MYFFNKREQNGWEQEYKDFECDADAMMYARTLLTDTCSIVGVYRHEDHDTCSRKQYIVAYANEDVPMLDIVKNL